MPTNSQANARLRPGSVYIAVIGTAALVSLMGLTAMQLSRLELRSTQSALDSNYARLLAQSSVEFALGRIDADSSWRSTYTHGEEKTASPMSYDETLRFVFLDNADNDLADDATEPVEIQGIGRWGTATAVYSVEYAKSTSASEVVGPLELHGFPDSGGSSAFGSITQYQTYAQYFQPSLPPEAVSWTITNVQILIQSEGATSSTLQAGLYHPDGSLQPGTLIETILVNENQLPSGTHSWHNLSFSQATNLTPGQALCLTLGSPDSSTTGSFKYAGGGVTTPNSHMIFGGSGFWGANESDKSFYFRILGIYETSTGGGEFVITPGSWELKNAP